MESSSNSYLVARDTDIDTDTETEGTDIDTDIDTDISSENYTCMYMTLNIKRHINFLIRHIIY